MKLGFITRRFKFSASHRYWIDSWSEEKNSEVFGSRVSKYGFGHNYILDVTVKGEIDEITGMVINLTKLKEIGDSVVSQFDHKFLNEQLPYFKNHQPTAENLSKLFWELLEPKMPEGVFLHRIRLYPSDEVFAEYVGEENFGKLCKTYVFSASHRLFTNKLSENENQQLYDKCYSEFGHGHNYKLTVYYNSEINKETGMSISLKQLDTIVNGFLKNKLHGKRLDVQIEELKDKSPTSENLTEYIFNQLKLELKENLTKIKLKETDNNFFEKEEKYGR